MELRRGKIEERADVVVVHVRDDDVLDRRGVDAEQRKPLGRRAQERRACAAPPASAVKPVSTTKVRSAFRTSHTK